MRGPHAPSRERVPALGAVANERVICGEQLFGFRFHDRAFEIIRVHAQVQPDPVRPGEVAEIVRRDQAGVDQAVGLGQNAGRVDDVPVPDVRTEDRLSGTPYGLSLRLNATANMRSSASQPKYRLR